ncbi:MAG: hypothetical protein ACE5D1_02770 [Fidelibacterota bacterium]
MALSPDIAMIKHVQMAVDLGKNKIISSTIRIGDLAGLMICAQYLKTFEHKKIHFEYLDNVHRNLKAHILFQQTVDRFVTEEYTGFDIYDPGNIWVVAPYYVRRFGKRVLPTLTVDSAEYSGPELDWGNYIVFAPLTDARYNMACNMSPAFIREVVDSLAQEYGEKLVVISRDGGWITDTQIQTIVWDDLYNIIYLISRSRMFIGGDTGFTHFAGLLRVPNLISLYYRNYRIDHYILNQGFDRPFSLQGQFIREPFDSRPNFDPDKTVYHNFIMENHRLNRQDFKRFLHVVAKALH